MTIPELIPRWQCLGKTGTSLTRGCFIVEVEIDGFGWSEAIPDSFLDDPQALAKKFQQMYAKALDILGYEVKDHAIH